MFVGNLTPLMIICGICGISADDPALYVTLLQNAMLAAGITDGQHHGAGDHRGEEPAQGFDKEAQRRLAQAAHHASPPL